MSANIYDNPNAFGLRPVGEVEFSSGSYEFDTTVVWQDNGTGDLYYGSDSGCSCPIPFASVDRSTITKIERIQDLIDHLAERRAEQYWAGEGEDEYYADRKASVDGQIGQLIVKAREAIR